MSENNIKENKKLYLSASLLLFLVFAIFRLVDLPADLPSYFDTGISVTDEGTYIDAPRKKTETGQWNLENEFWHSQKLTPLYAWTLQKVFALTEVSLKVARSLSVACSLLTLIFVWLTGRRLYNSRGAFVLLTLVGSSYLLTQFNRAAMVESMQLMFVWFGIWALSGKATPKREFLLGLAVSLTVLVKLSGAIAWPGVLLCYLFSQKIYQDRKRLLALAGGALLPFLLSEIFYPGFLLSSFQYSQENFGRLVSVKSAPWVLFHMSVPGMHLSREAPLMILALLGMVKIYRAKRNERQEFLLWAFFISVLFCSCLDLAVRRFLLFMPWMALLALEGFCGQTDDKKSQDSSLFSKAALLLFLFLFCSGVFMFLGHFRILAIKYIGAGGAVLALVIFAMETRNNILDKVLKLLRGRSLQFLLAMVLLLGLCQNANWFFNRSHHVDHVQKEMAKVLPENAVVYGNIAPMMTVGSKAQGFFLHGLMKDTAKWNFPESMYLVTYTQPDFGYENPYVVEVANLYISRVKIAGPWKMFGERDIVREVALFRLQGLKKE
jgi:4-amino-4-deoxy-L-arabinose transferase-like glycosyltransferase